jgi:hypothetical protein
MPFRTRIATAIAALLSTTAVLGSETTTVERHMVIDAEVTVVSSGEVGEILLRSPELPDPLDQMVQKSISELRFAPIEVDGEPADVTAQMTFSACFTSGPDQVALALDLLAHGPKATTRTFPPVPRELFDPDRLRRFEFVLTYVVEADGSARFEGMTHPGIPARLVRKLKRDYEKWIEGTTYRPERVNGQPVATRVEYPLKITIGPRAEPTNETAEATCARAREAAPQVPRLVSGPSRLQLLTAQMP